MIDGRIVLIIVPALFLWCLMIPSHRRNSTQSDKINVGSVIALFAGSNTVYVKRYAFGLQLGYLSMVLWYLLFSISNTDYVAVNAYVLSIITGAVTGLFLQRFLKMFVSKKSINAIKRSNHKNCEK